MVASVSFSEVGRLRRHRRIRKRVVGTAQRPRLSIHRSHRHLVAQLIDDTVGRTVALVSTRQADFRSAFPKGGNTEAATQLGKKVAEVAKAHGITQAVFDRGGYRYHGRVKALAEAARQQGLRI